MTNTAVSVSHLSCSYTNRAPELQVLASVSFQVERQQFISLIGPSGCGKSTLFSLLGNLEDPRSLKTTGRISIFGMSPESARKTRNIGIVFQKPALLPWRTIAQNIALPLEIMHLPHNENTIFKLLELVGLRNYADFYPHQLSGGMQQKAAIARALAYDPPLLLMDEPFGALDEISREKMNGELISIWKKTKKTILFVTHSIPEAVYLSQKIYVMTHRPGTITDHIDINLPYPRDRAENSPDFYTYVISVRKKLAQG